MKNMMTLIAFAITLSSCNKGERIMCFTPPPPVNIRYVDKNGADLLDPKNINGFKKGDISITYIKDGVKTNSEFTVDSLPDKKVYYLKTYIGWESDGGRTFSLKLSPSITDEVYARYDEATENHCGFTRFVEFKYNNTNYQQNAVDAPTPGVFTVIR